ncbi:MAG: hypothetical protein FWE71_16795 [Nocardioidaceae bacterium]|nr:hypothetical protein [Nocardioidaceae bacterium]MCL2615064.1 hypothetical protein [Nocardioidaceae bacterium]
MNLHDGPRVPLLAASAAAAAVLLAACGSGMGSSAVSGSGSSHATGTTGAETIGTAGGSAGTHLTGDDGRAVYLWVADTGTTSTCNGSCAAAWPPVLSKGRPKAEAGAKAADLGTTRRSDGSTQVTYRGHPLYYYAGDTAGGQTSGQGLDGFGAKWWLVSPGGSAITGAGSSGSGGGPGGY